VGLFAGVLKHLLARGSDCPKVIATTHFHELFSTGALDPQELPITFVHMEIMFTTRGGEIIDADSTRVTKGESITYLYRLVSSNFSWEIPDDGMLHRAENGLALESHAARCAQLFGVPAHIVQRAQYVTYVAFERLLSFSGKLINQKNVSFPRVKYRNCDFSTTAGPNIMKDVGN